MPVNLGSNPDGLRGLQRGIGFTSHGGEVENMVMNRRAFFGSLAALAAGAVLDPERPLWVPGKKLISIPKRLTAGMDFAREPSVTVVETWLLGPDGQPWHSLGDGPLEPALYFPFGRLDAVVFQTISLAEFRKRYPERLAKTAPRSTPS